MGKFLDKVKYFIGIDDLEEEEDIFEEEETLDVPMATRTKD